MTTGRLNTHRLRRFLECDIKPAKNVIGTNLRYRIKTDGMGGGFMVVSRSGIDEIQKMFDISAILLYNIP